MKNMEKNVENFKKKVEGKIKETIGKATQNQELELEGKMKKKIVEAKEKAIDLKDNLLEKINDKLDDSKR